MTHSCGPASAPPAPVVAVPPEPVIPPDPLPAIPPLAVLVPVAAFELPPAAEDDVAGAPPSPPEPPPPVVVPLHATTSMLIVNAHEKISAIRMVSSPPPTESLPRESFGCEGVSLSCASKRDRRESPVISLDC